MPILYFCASLPDDQPSEREFLAVSMTATRRLRTSSATSSDYEDDTEEATNVSCSPRRITRSMGIKVDLDPLELPPELLETPKKSLQRRGKQLSPYFDRVTPDSSARKRAAKVPIDLEPYVLAQQLRPEIPLHPGIQRRPTDFGLLQEIMVASPDVPVWKLIIAVSLLNQTAGRAVRPVLWQLLDQYPTPRALAEADEMELTALLYPIGLYRIRAKRLKAFSQLYIEQPPDEAKVYPNKNDKHYIHTPISHYPGVGTYCLDSYQIFYAGGGADVTEPRSAHPDAPWRSVMPADKELRKYLAWRWAVDGQLWLPEKGVLGPLPLGVEIPKPGHLTSEEAFNLAKSVSSLPSTP